MCILSQERVREIAALCRGSFALSRLCMVGRCDGSNRNPNSGYDMYHIESLGPKNRRATGLRISSHPETSHDWDELIPGMVAGLVRIDAGFRRMNIFAKDLSSKIRLRYGIIVIVYHSRIEEYHHHHHPIGYTFDDDSAGEPRLRADLAACPCPVFRWRPCRNSLAPRRLRIAVGGLGTMVHHDDHWCTSEPGGEPTIQWIGLLGKILTGNHRFPH